MIYAITYEIDGVLGPGGAVDAKLDKILDVAKVFARIALDQLDDQVYLAEWYDLSGNQIQSQELLLTKDSSELLYQISQINDELQSCKSGHLSYWEYQDIFQLVSEHDVESWCGDALKSKILNMRRDYHQLIQDISDEW